MQDFRTLRVWQPAIALAVLCYETTQAFPDDERFGLVSQMRRSAVSVSSNIAEGCGRNSRRDFVRFVRIAYGSACELESQARVAVATNTGVAGELAVVIDEAERTRRMLSALTNRVESDF